MRLIDADLLKQNCKCTGGFNDNFMCVDLITLAKVIDNQPTAYDVNKVVEKLEEIRVKKTCNKEKCDTKELYRICVVDDAIEIVKGGRVK